MFLGVDGGGTKTAFCLISKAGRILATHEESTSYYLEVGMEQPRKTLQRGTEAILKKLGLATVDLDYAFFGLPAYGEDSKLQDQLDNLPSAFLPKNKYSCDCDMICGWAGSLCGSDGINVIAGTGSMAYGEYQGRKARTGGWGELFSDEGSAYWIAREGLVLFSRMSDGRTPRGFLYQLFKDRFKLNSDLDLCGYVYSELAAQRSAIAQISVLVHEAALAGDVGAQKIFERAAGELAELVVAIRANLAVPSDVNLLVSYSGGVFTNGTLLLDAFRKSLASHSANYELIKPHLSPVLGAAIYAAKCAGGAINIDALKIESQSLKNIA